MDTKDFIQSKLFIKLLCIIGSIVVAILIFQAGMFVGFKKASFSFRGGENYYRNFGGQRGGFMGMHFRDNFQESHGAMGRIIKIDLPTFVIEDAQKTEKIVRLNDDTSIRSLRDTLKNTDLKINDFVTIIGSPNDKSEIEAKFIRLMPTPPSTSIQNLTSTSTTSNTTSTTKAK